MKTPWTMIGALALLLTACIAVPGPVPEPYYYSPSYCVGCWYGEWGGRTGYHRGSERPWERPHSEAEHHGQDRGRDVKHGDYPTAMMESWQFAGRNRIPISAAALRTVCAL